MSVIRYDGFSHYNNTVDLQSNIGALAWYVAPPVGVGSGTVTVLPTGGRLGKGALRINASWGGLGTLSQSLFGFYNNADPTSILGVAINMTSIDSNHPIEIAFLDATDSNVEQVHFEVHVAPAQIKAFRGGTLLGSSVINIFSAGGYNYFEFKTLTNLTGGTVAAQVNGQTVLSLTGQNTQQSPNASCTGFSFTGSAGNTTPTTFTIGDLYICNGINAGGTFPANSFLGNVRVSTTFPISDSAVQWTPLAGANWQEVSDPVFDGDASYNFTTTLNDADQFNFGTIDATVNAVIAVQLTGAYRIGGAGSHEVEQSIVSSGTVAAGSAKALSTSYQFFTDLFTTDPHTGANWTLPTANAITAGYKLIT